MSSAIRFDDTQFAFLIYSRFSHTRNPALTWDSTVAIRVAPLTIVYMCVIIYNPLFLQHVETTAYQFAHSLSVAFSILLSYLMLRTEISQRINSACIVVIFGTSVGSMGYLNFSWVGAFYCLAWPAIVAMYGIYLKKTLIALRNDFW
jgi:GDP-fucose transporter C1